MLNDPKIPSRIWEKIEVDPETNCWLWLGSLSGSSHLGGYPEGFHSEKKKVVKIHRWLYEELVGEIKPGLDLDHLCRVRRCCNPAHVEPVTRSENNKRGNAGYNMIEYWNNAITCPRGHEWTEENTFYIEGIQRYCRKCRQAQQRWRRAGKVGTIEDYIR
jgi:hypothetical protein